MCFIKEEFTERTHSFVNLTNNFLKIDFLQNGLRFSLFEDASYDVASLFTNMSAKETIEYILHKIYVDKCINTLHKRCNIDMHCQMYSK